MTRDERNQDAPEAIAVGAESGIGVVMLISTAIVFVGISTAWWLYNRRPLRGATEPDALERVQPDIFYVLRNKFFVDELYDATLVRLNRTFGWICDLMDRFVWLPRLKIDGALCREWCEEWWRSRERRRRLLAKGKSQLILIFV